MKPIYPKYFASLLLIIPTLIIVIFLVGYFGYVGFHSRANIDMRIEGDWPLQADEVLGFAAARNSLAVRHHVRRGLKYQIFVDRIGARINKSGQETPEKVGILTVGGSFSWGHGMDNERTFTEILGRKFNVPVANFAYASYGTVQSLQLLRRHSNLEPRLIIYGFITDHMQRNLSPCAPSYAPYCLGVSHIAFDEKSRAYIQSPVTNYSPTFSQAYFQAATDSEEFEFSDIYFGAKAVLSNIKRRTVWNYTVDKAYRRKSMDYLMENMIREARRINARLVVVYIPQLERGSTKPPPTELIEALNQDTIFVDLSGPIIQHYSNEGSTLLRFERDGHPNHLAHELIARAISRAIGGRVKWSAP